MIEVYFWHVLILLVTCMLHPIVFVASYLLLVSQELVWLPMVEVVFPLTTALAFPSVTTLSASAYTTVWMEQGGGLMMGVLILLILVAMCCYLFFASGHSGAWMHSRRIHQATNAMLLIYAVVLCFAAVKLISFAIPIGIISTAFIFMLSFVLLKKTKLPLFIILGLGILIAILLI